MNCIRDNKEPYFKLSRNEHGKAWLFYKPCGDGRYDCWEPIDEEFYMEFEKILNAPKLKSETESIITHSHDGSYSVIPKTDYGDASESQSY